MVRLWRVDLQKRGLNYVKAGILVRPKHTALGSVKVVDGAVLSLQPCPESPDGIMIVALRGIMTSKFIVQLPARYGGVVAVPLC